MPTVVRREPRACPVCSLSLTLVTADDGITFEYDVADWARHCRHPDCGTPLACPALRPTVKGRIRRG